MDKSRHVKYLKLAFEISRFSKCLCGHWGAVIVKDDTVLGIGYNGPARGVHHCSTCRRGDVKPGEAYDKCVAAHAEVNALLQAGGRERCYGAYLYIASHNRPPDMEVSYNRTEGFFPCDQCFRYIVNAGITKVIQPTTATIGEDNFCQVVNVIDVVNRLNQALLKDDLSRAIGTGD